LRHCTVGVNGKEAFLNRKDIVVAGNTLLLLPKYGSVGRKGGAKITLDCPKVNIDGEIAQADVQVYRTKFLIEQLGGNAVSTPGWRNRYAPNGRVFGPNEINYSD